MLSLNLKRMKNTHFLHRKLFDQYCTPVFNFLNIFAAARKKGATAYIFWSNVHIRQINCSPEPMKSEENNR